jgi:hypothetical protein
MERDDPEKISILKSIWRKDVKGIWCVHDLQGIELKPQDGHKPDFFKIQDDVSLLTKRPVDIMENFFASFGTTEFLVRQSIVPVVSWNDGDLEIRCIGTGFFISASGLLITAAHVLRDPVDENYTTSTPIGDSSFKLGESLRMGVLIPVNPAAKNAPFQVLPAMRDAKFFIAPIEWAVHWGSTTESPLVHQKPEFRLDVDIAVCKVKDNIIGGSYQPLNIGLHNLRVGDRAVAIGYAEMQNILLSGNNDYQPELTVSVGTVTNIILENHLEKQNSTPGPNFEFDAEIPGKMSGSPILVGGGILTKGVVSRSLGRGVKHASGCLIAAVMGMKLAQGKSLLDLMERGEEGIAKMIGRDL